MGCGSDQKLVGTPDEAPTPQDTACAEARVAFDAEEVSVLENALGIVGGRDAIELALPESRAFAGMWRVRRVDVLVVLPRWGFEEAMEGQRLTVQVWAGHDLTIRPWQLTQAFAKDGLDWTHVELPHATNTSIVDHRAAWWSFDLDAVVPEGAIIGVDYAVGMRWMDPEGEPPLGYSNYVFPCAANWTDWGGTDAWAPNDGGASCSWPMLRVHAEGIGDDAACP